MITIIVGVPGAGKTLYAVTKIREEYKDQQVYYHNIPGVTLDGWLELQNPEEWHKLPNGSVVVVDEAHEVFPKRDYKVKEPEHIAAAATLRHRGHHLVLITQHPVDLDIFLRRRCARFIFLKKPLSKGNYANAYMWGEYVEKYKDEREQEKADSFQFNYPKEAFGSYTSAQLHNGKRYLPKALKRGVAIVVIGIGVCGYAIYSIVDGLSHKEETIAQYNEQTSTVATTRPQRFIDRFIPRVADLPYTAPIYDEVARARTFPRVQCLSSADKCLCYTQQATRLYISDPVCRRMVVEGIFDYTKPDKGNQRGRI